jgi:hypothetical protein
MSIRTIIQQFIKQMLPFSLKERCRAISQQNRMKTFLDGQVVERDGARVPLLLEFRICLKKLKSAFYKKISLILRKIIS